MDPQLTGKTALVTGASRGIGLAIARGLAAEGVKVTDAARTISVTHATYSSCQQSGRRSAQLTESKRTDRSDT